MAGFLRQELKVELDGACVEVRLQQMMKERIEKMENSKEIWMREKWTEPSQGLG